MEKLLQSAPRFLFFTGKGGVGKTSMACASAVALASNGKRVLLVSTDPASNLDEVLETSLGSRPVPIRGLDHLEALNIDPVAAATEYRERIIAPYRGLLPEAAVRNIEEQLSGACTVEIASFNEFTRLIGNEDAIEGYDHVILDTAPTGHTLRLLALPAAWNDFIANNASGSSCLGPLAGLKEQRLTYERAVAALNDPAKTLLVLVTRPDRAATKEAARASTELASLGMKRQALVINGVFAAEPGSDSLAVAFANRCRTALDALPATLRDLPQVEIPFRASGFLGVSSLQAAFGSASPQPEVSASDLEELPFTTSFDSLLDDLSRAGSGVILTMGKGGVGKTTLAAAVACKLARRGYPVHLSTTDPAAHVRDAVENPLPNLQISRIDPAVETQQHIARVMEANAGQLDPEALALLKEELGSPCTEEIAVFQAFAKLVAQGEQQFVVLDTAPTGHTLLLLDATEAYHREVLRTSSSVPDAVRCLLPRLRDPDFTKVLLVTLPEATPVHEAAQLQHDLQRAGITPHAWIINQSFAAAGPRHPTLIARARMERKYITEVIEELSPRTLLLPWSPTGVIGNTAEQAVTTT